MLYENLCSQLVRVSLDSKSFSVTDQTERLEKALSSKGNSNGIQDPFGHKKLPVIGSSWHGECTPLVPREIGPKVVEDHIPGMYHIVHIMSWEKKRDSFSPRSFKKFDIHMTSVLGSTKQSLAHATIQSITDKLANCGSPGIDNNVEIQRPSG